MAKGSLAALAVVATRLALPWPLRAIADLWVPSGGDTSQTVFGSFPWALDPVLAMGGTFLVLVSALGVFDALERLCFARFSIATVSDLRAAAFKRALRSREAWSGMQSGDLVARLVGDSARVKNGLRGFLVHVATNGILFSGVTLVLFRMNRSLGLIFALAGIGTAGVATAGAARILRNCLSERRKEGRLASRIEKGLRKGPAGTRFARVNRSSARHDAAQTRIQGIATGSAHVIFGGAMFTALCVGVRAVDSGQIETGDLVLFMMYALTMHGPTVRLARQGSRTGRILGAAHRLVQILEVRDPTPRIDAQAGPRRPRDV